MSHDIGEEPPSENNTPWGALQLPSSELFVGHLQRSDHAVKISTQDHEYGSLRIDDEFLFGERDFLVATPFEKAPRASQFTTLSCP